MKKKIASLSLATIIGFSAFTPAVSADEVTNLEKKQQEVKTDRSKVQKQIEEADTELVSVLYEIETLNNKIGKLDANIKKTQKDITKNEKAIKKLEQELFEIEERIVERLEILKNRLVAMQATGGAGQTIFLDTLAGEITFSEAVSRANAIKNISESDIKLVKDLEKDQKAEEKKQKELEGKEKELKAAKEKAEKEKKSLNSEKATLKEKETKLKNLKNSLQVKDDELKSLQSSIRSEIAAAQQPAEPEIQTVSARDAVRQTSNNTANSSNNQTTTANETNTNQASSNNGSSSNSSQPAPSKPAPSKPKPEASQPAPPANGGSAISRGMSQLGTKYVYGTMNPGVSFDCSGFVSYALGTERRTTASFKSISTKISYSQAQPGDLVYFDTFATDSHMGIYIGGGKFIAANTTNGVEIKAVKGPYWGSVFKGHVRRLN